jgi:hypothetical protein
VTVRVFAHKDGASAEDHRLALSLMMAGAGPGVLDRRAGIVPYPGACDLTGVSPMVGRISPFVAWVDGSSGTNQGGYPVVVDANVDLTHDPGEAGNSRIDRYVLQIRDNPYDASTFQDGRVVIVKGQAGGAANPVPASSILLWEVTVPAGASVGGGGFTMSSARADKRTYTAALGAAIPVRNQAERDALVAFEGLEVYRLDAHAKQIYTGTGGWVWLGGNLSASKAATENLVNNSFADDPHLQITTPPGIRYELSATFFYSAHQDADFKFQFLGPNNFYIDYTVRGLPSASTGVTGPTDHTHYFPGFQQAVFGGPQANNSATVAGTVTGTYYSGDGGVFKVQRAQGATHATPSIFRASSYVILRPML